MDCWRCRYPFEYSKDAEGWTEPREGDVTLCWQCGAIGIVRLVDGAPSIEAPTPAEVEELQTPAFIEQAAKFEIQRRVARRAARRG